MNISSIYVINQANAIANIPRDLYLDTSFINEIYGNGNSFYKNIGSNFLNECAANNTTFYISSLVEEELEHLIIKSTIIDYAKSNNITIPMWKDNTVNMKELYNAVLNNNKNVTTIIDNEINRVIGIIESFTEFLEYTDDREFEQDVRNLLRKYYYLIDTKDAKHIIIMRRYGINCIATVDKDYAIAENLNIYAMPTKFYKDEVIKRSNIFSEFDNNTPY